MTAYLGGQRVVPAIKAIKKETLNVTPSTSVQTLTPTGGVDCYDEVDVAAVTSSIDSNIKADNIKKDVTILGVTGTLEGNDFYVLDREVSPQGVYKMPSTSFTFTLPSEATDVGNGALSYAFYRCTSLTSVDLSDLTTISGSSGMGSAFYGCTKLTSVDLSNLTTISGSSGMGSAFYGCTKLTSVDLSSLTTISGSSGIFYAFNGCKGLTSVDLSSLTTISGISGMSYAFYGCKGLTSVDLSNLTTVRGYYGMSNAFQNCTSLQVLSFPSLTSTSFGSYTNQFNKMLQGVTGCTVHFPSNLQSVIGSWSDVTAGFGGTNTTVLYDLPATT